MCPNGRISCRCPSTLPTTAIKPTATENLPQFLLSPRIHRSPSFSIGGEADSGYDAPKAHSDHSVGNHPLMDWGVWPLDNDDTTKSDWEVASRAIEMLENMPDGKPFFLTAGFFFPRALFCHTEVVRPHPDDVSVLLPMPKDDRDDTPRLPGGYTRACPNHGKSGSKRMIRRSTSAPYFRLTSFIDTTRSHTRCAGKTGHTDDTIVVLRRSRLSLGRKADYRKIRLRHPARVPLIFAGPGVTPVRYNRPAELLDIYPTCRSTDLPEVDHLEGLSLSRQLTNANVYELPAITSHNQGNYSVERKVAPYPIR